MVVKSVKFLSSIFIFYFWVFLCFDKRQKPKELGFVILRFNTQFDRFFGSTLKAPAKESNYFDFFNATGSTSE